jgi:hypothetical protein
LLSDILVLNREVLAYSTSDASCRRVLVANGFEVLALAFLRKGNASVVSIDDAAIEFKVVGGGKAFTFLS